MKLITIIRTHLKPTATYGTIDDEGDPFAQTLEPPWKDNQPFISCIPAGERICKRHSSEKYPNTWEITGVEGRDKVLIHWGNYPKDTEGCVIVGEHFSVMKGIVAVADSRTNPNEGFCELMLRTAGLDEFKLVIKEIKNV